MLGFALQVAGPLTILPFSADSNKQLPSLKKKKKKEKRVECKKCMSFFFGGADKMADGLLWVAVACSACKIIFHSSKGGRTVESSTLP